MKEEEKKTAPEPATQEAQIQSFDPTAKKKKKPTKKTEKKAETEAKKEQVVEQKTEVNEEKKGDYTYEYMLERITALLDNKAKDSAAKRKVVIKPPDVQRLTGKRSAWVNFKVRAELMVV